MYGDIGLDIFEGMGGKSCCQAFFVHGAVSRYLARELDGPKREILSSFKQLGMDAVPIRSALSKVRKLWKWKSMKKL